MKKITIILTIILLSFLSCNKPDYTIEQKIIRFAGETQVQTLVWDKRIDFYHDIIWSSYDDIFQPNIDSIKCLRYNQAKDFISTLNRLNELNCE